MQEVYFDERDIPGPVPTGADKLIQLMRERGQDYWNDAEDGSGFKTLEFYAEGRASEVGCTSDLVFTKNDQHGFHFYFNYRVSWVDSPYYRDMESFYSCSNPELSDWVEVMDPCEGAIRIFTGLFVPVETAIEVVRDFVRTGEPSPRIQWVTGRVIREAEQRLREGQV
ncbi:MAG: hypothetical protein ACRC8S_15295 [Fimbriiglobus sp.]